MPIGGRLSFGLGFGACGLLVSLVSFLGYQHLTAELSKLELDMNAGRLDLLNDLSRLLTRVK
jgi:hypothetical protein